MSDFNTWEWLSEWAISGYGYVLKHDFIHWSSDYLVNNFCSFWTFKNTIEMKVWLYDFRSSYYFFKHFGEHYTFNA